MRSTIHAALSVSLVAVSTSSAAPFIYDGFGTSAAPAPAGQYEADAALAGEGNGSGAWTGDWVTVGTVTTASGSLTATGATNDPGRALTTTGGGAMEMVRSFSASGFGALGDEVWFSYLFRRDGGSNSSSFRIADSNTRYFGVSFPNTPNDPSELRADLRFSGSTVEASAAFVPVTNDNTYFVVGRFQFNDSANDVLDVWVNPTSVASVAALGAATLSVSTANTYSTFDEIRINNGGNASYSYDEIAVGGALADVVVPEPASLAAIGMLSVLGVRRRPRA